MKEMQQKLQQHISNAWQNWPEWVMAMSATVLVLLWVAVILPADKEAQSRQNTLNTAQEELASIKGWAEQIKQLENGLSSEEQASSEESLLQQVERLGKETKVFNKISRISPSKVRTDGREYEGISLEYDQTSMAEIAPFLEAIAYRSILSVHELNIQKYGEADGIISVRLTLVGGKIS